MNQPQDVEELKELSILLDTKFRGPFGISFGLDAIIGLIPVLGDVITSGLSFYIIIKAAYLGCTPATLIRMAFNVLMENLIDMIPFVGNLFDFVWKSNVKNLSLLQAHLQNPRRVTMQSRVVLTLIILTLVGAMVLTAWVSWMLLAKILELF